MEDIDYGFKTAIRHRIVLEQKELCHAQTQLVCARLAQLVRSLTANQEVPGSSPGLVEG